MKITEIDNPSNTPIRVYLDVESFRVTSEVLPKTKYTPQWVRQTIDKLSYDFEFYGLLHRDLYNFVKSSDEYDFVQEVIEFPRENWAELLREVGAIMFYLGKPSHVEILQHVPSALSFPFTSSPEIIKHWISTNVGLRTVQTPPIFRKRGKDNRVVKFIKDILF